MIPKWFYQEKDSSLSTTRWCSPQPFAAPFHPSPRSCSARVGKPAKWLVDQQKAFSHILPMVSWLCSTSTHHPIVLWLQCWSLCWTHLPQLGQLRLTPRFWTPSNLLQTSWAPLCSSFMLTSWWYFSISILPPFSSSSSALFSYSCSCSTLSFLFASLSFVRSFILVLLYSLL